MKLVEILQDAETTKKATIASILKKLGFTSPKFTGGSRAGKTIKGLNSDIKGIPGSSIGPMTSTNAYRGVIAEITDKVKREFKQSGLDVQIDDVSSWNGHPAFTITVSGRGGKAKRLAFRWTDMPSYAGIDRYDSSYKTFWLCLFETKDITLTK
jgi:hypothetical protein